MSINPVSTAHQTELVAQPTASQPKPPVEKPQTQETDTYQPSAAYKAAQAALQEATETPAQTAKEARSGDPQAQRLIAKEAAAERLRSPQQK
jgi:hypothetical protein